MMSTEKDFQIERSAENQPYLPPSSEKVEPDHENSWNSFRDWGNLSPDTHGEEEFPEEADLTVSRRVDGIGAGETGANHRRDDSPSFDSSELSGDVENWMHGFEIGDMVWGRVKSHPWWPGFLFNEAFASPMVRRTRREGHVLVAFFGDSSYGWFNPAELVPYDPHFAEKSRQTSSRNFARAVEESIEEAGRRRALGLSCRCRNPLNFRSTSVPGYFSVDLVNHEVGGVYSIKQIKKARDMFIPVDVVSFVKSLAAAPRDAPRGSGSINWISNMAMLLSLRKATFEEFDETYAQAFGVEPVRPSRDAVKVLEQPVNIARAPLTGPLVFAETSGAKTKSFSKSTPKHPKDRSAKKDKYLFKRRDNPPTSTKPPPDLPHIPQPEPESEPTPDYVLDRRTPTPPIHNHAAEETPSKPEYESNEMSLAPVVPVVKPKNKKGRVKEEDAGLEKPKKKRKKKEAVRVEPGVPRKEEKQIDVKAPTPASISTYDEVVETGRPVVPLPALELDPRDLDVPLLVSDLSALALDPFHGFDRKASLVVRHYLLKFRSLVYQKSVVVPEPDVSEAHVRKPEPAVGFADRGLIPKKTKVVSRTIVRPDDPTRSGRKRAPSDRQEELSTKKVKKMKQIKALASEKRSGGVGMGEAKVVSSATSVKSGELTKKHNDPYVVAKKHESLTPSKKQEPASVPKKQEPAPAPPKINNPTFLMMKFPPRSTLPSIASMKARFGRFGPLDLSGARVYWGSYTCKVLFKHRADAQAAYMYARNNDVFGQIKVNYSLRDAEQPETGKRDDDTTQTRPGRNDDNVNSPRPLKPQSRQQSVQLKSCLKKPSGDETGSSTAKETPRVKFLLESEREQSAYTSLLPTDINPRNARSVSFAPSRPSLAPLPVSKPPHDMPNSVPPYASAIPRTSHMQPLLPNNLQISQTQSAGQEHAGPSPYNRRVQSYEALERRGGVNIDISHEMMSLLRRCNDVVSNVQTALGYIPYHTL